MKKINWKNVAILSVLFLINDTIIYWGAIIINRYIMG